MFNSPAAFYGSFGRRTLLLLLLPLLKLPIIIGQIGPVVATHDDGDDVDNDDGRIDAR